jgi:DNA polymerase (family X)
MFGINPDAHSIGELDLTRWGVLMARKGGLPRERVLNCVGAKGLQAWLEDRRASAASYRAHQTRAGGPA